MMPEVDETEREAFDAFGEVVDAFGRSGRDVRAMPCGDLCRPLLDGAAEALILDGHRLVGEVADDLSDPLVSEFGVAVGVCLANDFLRVPREPDFLFRVASAQQSDQSFVLIGGESLGRDRESTTHTVERIVAATAMPTGLVLDAPAALIESGARELDDVESPTTRTPPDSATVDPNPQSCRPSPGSTSPNKKPSSTQTRNVSDGLTGSALSR